MANATRISMSVKPRAGAGLAVMLSVLDLDRAGDPVDQHVVLTVAERDADPAAGRRAVGIEAETAGAAADPLRRCGEEAQSETRIELWGRPAAAQPERMAADVDRHRHLAVAADRDPARLAHGGSDRARRRLQLQAGHDTIEHRHRQGDRQAED